MKPCAVASYSAQQVNSPIRSVASERPLALFLSLRPRALRFGDRAHDVLDEDQLALHVGAHLVGHDQFESRAVGSVMVLPPYLRQHARLEADPVVAPARKAGIGPRGRIAAFGRSEYKIEQMD